MLLQYDKRNNRQMVNMYKNKMTGDFKGEAMITYDDPQAAKAAIEWFNGQWPSRQFDANTHVCNTNDRPKSPWRNGSDKQKTLFAMFQSQTKENRQSD